MKEGGGGDHVNVGVRKPRSKRIRPISKRDIFVRPPSMIIVEINCALIIATIFHHVGEV